MNNSHSLVMKSARLFLAMFLVAVPLLFSTATIEGFEDVKAAALTLTALVFAACWLASFQRTSIHLAALRQPLVLGVVLFAVSAGVSTVLSISPRTSWRGAYESHGGLLTILGYVVLFFAARRLGGGRRLLVGVVLAAAVASVYGIVQAARLDPITWDEAAFFGAQPRPFATMGHANLLGAYLALSLPFIAYFTRRAVLQRRWLLLGALAVIAGAVGVTLVLTLSRAAWLATGCAALVLLGGWWSIRAWRSGLILLAVLLLVGSVGVTVYQRHWLPESVQTALGERLRHLDDGAARSDIWRAGLEIYEDHWATGSGLDTFRLAFGSKRTAAYWDKEGEATPTKAHNEAIHILATQGTLGGVALLLVCVGLGWATARAWRNTQDPALVAALAASAVAFVVTNLFGYTVIATGSLFAVCAGLLARLAQPDALEAETRVAQAGWRLWTTPAIAIAAVVVAYLFVGEPLLANLACRRGDLLLTDNIPAAEGCYEQATERDPDNDLYWVRRADAARREALRNGSKEELHQARTALEQATALVPADAYHHANLARLLGEMARTDRSVHETAVAEWQQAAALDPNNPYILAEASRTALVVGQYALAREYAKKGAELYPTWAIFHAQLGAASLGQDDLPDAVRGLEEALNEDWHNDGEAYGRDLAMLASAQLRLADFGKAQGLAAEASRWLPQWPVPHLIRAKALEELGQRNEAVREMMTARSLQGLPMTALTSSPSPH